MVRSRSSSQALIFWDIWSQKMFLLFQAEAFLFGSGSQTHMNEYIFFWVLIWFLKQQQSFPLGSGAGSKMCSFEPEPGQRFTPSSRVRVKDLRLRAGAWAKICSFEPKLGQIFSPSNRSRGKDLLLRVGAGAKICTFEPEPGKRFAPSSRSRDKIYSFEAKAVKLSCISIILLYL